MEEGTVEQKPQRRWQGWRRILLVFILFSVLAGSLIYYVVPRVLTRPLRKDPIPSDAYIVPWLKPNPSFEAIKSMTSWNIDAVMVDALELDITFKIAITRFNDTRVVPSTVYLGHDKDYLYIGGKFSGMGQNPASTPDLTLTNYFRIYSDVANDGVLNFPESGSSFVVAVNPEAELRGENDSWSTGLIWYHEDLVWSLSTERLGQYVWLRGEIYYSPKAQPASALGAMDALYDTATDTVIILFSRYLRQPASSEINALQMRGGERWVMGFLLELGYNTWYGGYQDFVDGWPQKIYPYLDNDSSWWPKLVIDLANPPSGFST